MKIRAVTILEVYEACIAFWPKEISITDCFRTYGQGVRCPELIRCFNRADEQALPNELYAIMTWKIFGAFWRKACDLLEQEIVTSIYLFEISSESVISSFWDFYNSEDSYMLKSWLEEQGITLISDSEMEKGCP